MPNTSKKSATAASTNFTPEEVKKFTFLSTVVLLGRCASALVQNKNAKELLVGLTGSLAVITTLDLGHTLAKKRKEQEAQEEREFNKKAEEFVKEFDKKYGEKK